MERNLFEVTMKTSKKYPERRPENLDLVYSPFGNPLRFLSGSIAENPTWIFCKKILLFELALFLKAQILSYKKFFNILLF